jgi:hypothetical protein
MYSILGALRRSLLYLQCNWVALNLRFFDIYNITYQEIKIKIHVFHFSPNIPKTSGLSHQMSNSSNNACIDENLSKIM